MGKPWRQAMCDALYGPAGFFVGNRPASAFRTSAVASPLFGGAIARILASVDVALGQPAQLDLVDVGAGAGELLQAVESAAPPEVRRRLRLTAVELAPRPPDVSRLIAWRSDLPPAGSVTGLMVATEWLDNVPFDLAVRHRDRWYYVDVEADGDESLGAEVSQADAGWIARWWPETDRVELGTERDRAWKDAVSCVRQGVALAVDYGHVRSDRPSDTITGYRDGRQVEPRLDGSTDITAHVAIDAVAVAGWRASVPVPQLVRQRTALRALGVHGGRPPLALAATDPTGYVHALAAASVAGDLTNPAGLGAHWWLMQPVGLSWRLSEPETSAGTPAGSPPLGE